MESVDLTALRVGARTTIPKATMEQYKISTWHEVELDALVLKVERQVWSRELDKKEIRYPATWWDALKDRWFPAWALVRWPVQFCVHSWKAYHTYPGLTIQGQEPRLRILTYKGELEQ